MTERLMEAPFQHVEVADVYMEPARHRAELAASAMTGFTIMDTVRGPWERVRQELETNIIDQDPAIDAIIDALDLSGARLIADKRPMANLAFLGPTGVGKSETAKTLSDVLREGNPNLIKIDCSNFSHGHEVASLIGAPPGFSGHGEAPVLEKGLVEQYGTVILFDEVEKGSPKLHDLMLQIMGDGTLQLSNGEIVEFKNAIVIMTSNLGAREMSSKLSTNKLGFVQNDMNLGHADLDTVAMRGFNEAFRPEFINRIDRSVVFHPLSGDGLGRVLDNKLAKANTEYEHFYGARLGLSDGAKAHLVEAALQQPHMGARPLIRAFEQQVQATFGRYLGVQAIGEGMQVRVFHPREVDVTSESNELIFASAPDATLRRAVVREIVHVPTDDEATVLETEIRPEGERVE